MAAVEWRDGEQVEDEQSQVDLNGSDAEEDDGLHGGVDAGNEFAIERVHDDFASVGNRVDDDEEDECGGNGKDEVGGGGGKRGGGVVAAGLGGVAGGGGGGVGPTH